MKVMLINPPYFQVYRGYEKAAKIGASYPPTGLQYLAAMLQANGHEVRLEDMAATGMAPDELLANVREFDPGLVGVTATTPIFHNACAIAKEIKSLANIPVVLGGIHVTILKEECLESNPELDYAVLGEGEVTLLELVRCLEAGGDPASVEGILYRRDGRVLATPRRAMAPDLDAFPLPCTFPLDKWLYTWTAPGKDEEPIGVILTQRGCPFTCTFCSQSSMFTRKLRFRSVESVLDELDILVNDLGFKHVIFLDDTLAIRPARMMEMCRGIHERGLKFTWEGMCHAHIVNEELVHAMAKAGMTRISYGIESGDEEILKRIEKKSTPDDIRRAYRWAKEAGMETRGSAIIGHPGETKKSAWKTIWFLRRLRHLDQAYINIMVPYPGTPVYDLAKKGEAGYRLFSEDFSHYIRYNQSVLEVNDLTLDTLRRMQNLGLWLFYLTPHRVWYNLRRSGLTNGFRMAWAMLCGLLSRSSGRINPTAPVNDCARTTEM